MDFYDRRQLAVCPTEFGKIEHYDIKEPVVKKQKRIFLLCDIESKSTPDKSAPIHSAQAELNLFQKETPIAETEDPLMWWKLNNHCFPVLSIFVQTILCVPETSVPHERLFSSAGYIVNKMRSSLLPENA